MKYLLYGIVEQDLAGCPPGTCLLTAHGLAAAVSAVEEMSSPPSVSSLLAYERVVEAIHARQAVIPLRYGCVMENEAAVVRLLEDHRQEYGALLARLLGMTEMGIRILWPARAGVLPNFPSSPGAAYLASLRNRYNSAEALAPEEAQLADRIMGLLSGCSTEQRREVSSSSQGRSRFAILSDAENLRGTVSAKGSANLSSRRGEAVVEWAMAAVQLRGIFWLILWNARYGDKSVMVLRDFRRVLSDFSYHILTH